MGSFSSLDWDCVASSSGTICRNSQILGLTIQDSVLCSLYPLGVKLFKENIMASLAESYHIIIDCDAIFAMPSKIFTSPDPQDVAYKRKVITGDYKVLLIFRPSSFRSLNNKIQEVKRKAPRKSLEPRWLQRLA